MRSGGCSASRLLNTTPESYPVKSLLLEERNHQHRIDSPFAIVYEGLSGKEIGRLKNEAYKAAKHELERNGRVRKDKRTNVIEQAMKTGRESHSVWTWLSVPIASGPITDTASVPERDVVIDPSLVWQANDEIVGEQSASMQLERGQFLEELLMPQRSAQAALYQGAAGDDADATTARIHWEMIAQPTSVAVLQNQDSQSSDAIPF